ncbi:actin-like ATPase domain-containing protein [Rhizophagus irregularis]|uniref:Actin-like ATPase domain-containing protein n=1 Tax=Rhizophagus irregularis TaxID=588596 RepID=A0A2N0Q0K8_9GLOM|nr:actin-like ATPase domain-containing protein [Rhizophagus irregularis]
MILSLKMLKRGDILHYLNDQIEKIKKSGTRPVELFKLHLACNKKPYLPRELCYEKAIADYLRKIGQVIKDNIEKTWCVNFMVADVGGGTVDLTTHKLLENNKLDEITERTGDFCGSTYIDQEFINFLRKKLGSNSVDLLIENNYNQFQYMVQNFCKYAKIPFTGDPSESRYYELDIQECAPNLLQYVSEETRFKMEENEWLIEIDYEDIKAMFDPVVDRIIRLIHLQLSNAREKCSAIFLAGGFSESVYLQKRIKKEFQHVVENIRIPMNPIAVISRGAVMYGLSRILILHYFRWTEIPISRILHNGRIIRLHCLAKRGTKVEMNQKVTTFFTPLSPLQTRVRFKIFFTKEYNAKYCDEPGMQLLGKLVVNLPGSGSLDRLLFEFTFGQMEITVNVKNEDETNGKRYSTTFKLETD